MYRLVIKNNSQVVSTKEYSSIEEIEEFLYEEHHEKGFEYEIIEISSKSIIEEGEIESSDDVNDVAMDNMFPDEDSMEGFDWTFE